MVPVEVPFSKMFAPMIPSPSSEEVTVPVRVRSCPLNSILQKSKRQELKIQSFHNINLIVS